MNQLDIILLFIIVVSVATGLRRGLIRVLISVLGIYVTVVFVGYAHRPMGDTVAGGTPPGT